jgi:hypothetical protein
MITVSTFRNTDEVGITILKHVKMVGATGVEPARITPQDPKSCASANSATRPRVVQQGN